VQNKIFLWSGDSGVRPSTIEGADDLCWYSVENRAQSVALFCQSSYLPLGKGAATEEEEEASGRTGTAKMVHFRECCLGIFKFICALIWARTKYFRVLN